jgi:hypothetical protein
MGPMPGLTSALRDLKSEHDRWSYARTKAGSPTRRATGVARYFDTWRSPRRQRLSSRPSPRESAQRTTQGACRGPQHACSSRGGVGSRDPGDASSAMPLRGVLLMLCGLRSTVGIAGWAIAVFLLDNIVMLCTTIQLVPSRGEAPAGVNRGHSGEGTSGEAAGTTSYGPLGGPCFLVSGKRELGAIPVLSLSSVPSLHALSV